MSALVYNWRKAASSPEENDVRVLLHWFVLGRMCGNRRSSKYLGPLHDGGLCQLAGKFEKSFTLFRASQGTVCSPGENTTAQGLGVTEALLWPQTVLGEWWQ